MSKIIRNKNNNEFYILNLSMTKSMKNQILSDSLNNKRMVTNTLRSIIKKFINQQKKEDAKNTELQH
jgi:hypothetical protein